VTLGAILHGGEFVFSGGNRGVKFNLEGLPMTRNELLERITVDPNICFGKPCIRGHRIWVALILDFLASGMSTEEILEEYPSIEKKDVLACIAYGAERSSERYFEVSVAG